jgi:hypothetical protein
MEHFSVGRVTLRGLASAVSSPSSCVDYSTNRSTGTPTGQLEQTNANA